MGTLHYHIDLAVNQVIDHCARSGDQRDPQIAENQNVGRHHAGHRQQHANQGRQNHEHHHSGLAHLVVVPPAGG